MNEPQDAYIELNVTGRCWACGMDLRDHTIAQLDLCADMPLAIIIVKEEELEQ
jgi:hypothetical protein